MAGCKYGERPARQCVFPGLAAHIASAHSPDSDWIPLHVGLGENTAYDNTTSGDSHTDWRGRVADVGACLRDRLGERTPPDPVPPMCDLPAVHMRALAMLAQLSAPLSQQQAETALAASLVLSAQKDPWRRLCENPLFMLADSDDLSTCLQAGACLHHVPENNESHTVVVPANQSGSSAVAAPVCQPAAFTLRATDGAAAPALGGCAADLLQLLLRLGMITQAQQTCSQPCRDCTLRRDGVARDSLAAACGEGLRLVAAGNKHTAGADGDAGRPYAEREAEKCAAGNAPWSCSSSGCQCLCHFFRRQASSNDSGPASSGAACALSLGGSAPPAAARVSSPRYRVAPSVAAACQKASEGDTGASLCADIHSDALREHFAACPTLEGLDQHGVGAHSRVSHRCVGAPCLPGSGVEQLHAALLAGHQVDRLRTGSCHLCEDIQLCDVPSAGGRVEAMLGSTARLETGSGPGGSLGARSGGEAAATGVSLRSAAGAAQARTGAPVQEPPPAKGGSTDGDLCCMGAVSASNAEARLDARLGGEVSEASHMVNCALELVSPSAWRCSSAVLLAGLPWVASGGLTEAAAVPQVAAPESSGVTPFRSRSSTPLSRTGDAAAGDGAASAGAASAASSSAPAAVHRARELLLAAASRAQAAMQTLSSASTRVQPVSLPPCAGPCTAGAGSCAAGSSWECSGRTADLAATAATATPQTVSLLALAARAHLLRAALALSCNDTAGALLAAAEAEALLQAELRCPSGAADAPGAMATCASRKEGAEGASPSLSGLAPTDAAGAGPGCACQAQLCVLLAEALALQGAAREALGHLHRALHQYKQALGHMREACGNDPPGDLLLLCAATVAASARCTVHAAALTPFATPACTDVPASPFSVALSSGGEVKGGSSTPPGNAHAGRSSALLAPWRSPLAVPWFTLDQQSLCPAAEETVDGADCRARYRASSALPQLLPAHFPRPSPRVVAAAAAVLAPLASEYWTLCGTKARRSGAGAPVVAGGLTSHTTTALGGNPSTSALATSEVAFTLAWIQLLAAPDAAPSGPEQLPWASPPGDGPRERLLQSAALVSFDAAHLMRMAGVPDEDAAMQCRYADAALLAAVCAAAAARPYRGTDCCRRGSSPTLLVAVSAQGLSVAQPCTGSAPYDDAWDCAWDWAKAALQIRQTLYGVDAEASLEVQAFLAHVAGHGMGLWTASEPLLSSVVALRAEALGPGHPATQAAALSQADLLLAHGRLRAADGALVKLLPEEVREQLRRLGGQDKWRQRQQQQQQQQLGCRAQRRGRSALPKHATSVNASHDRTPAAHVLRWGLRSLQREALVATRATPLRPAPQLAWRASSPLPSATRHEAKPEPCARTGPTDPASEPHNTSPLLAASTGQALRLGLQAYHDAGPTDDAEAPVHQRAVSAVVPGPSPQPDAPGAHSACGGRFTGPVAVRLGPLRRMHSAGGVRLRWGRSAGPGLCGRAHEWHCWAGRRPDESCRDDPPSDSAARAGFSGSEEGAGVGCQSRAPEAPPAATTRSVVFYGEDSCSGAGPDVAELDCMAGRLAAAPKKAVPRGQGASRGTDGTDLLVDSVLSYCEAAVVVCASRNVVPTGA